MKMGIKEFRERISEVTEIGDPVLVTHHGQPVASYKPFRRKDPEQVRLAAAAIRQWQDEMRADGIDLEAILADLGMDAMGNSLDASDR